MATENSLSRRVLKAMGIFGGTQIITILCSVIRSKLVALWIGPAGFGLLAIFNSVMELLGQITSLGIRNAAVRDVAAHSSDPERVARVAKIVARWGVILGVIGLLLTTILSPFLSIISFGNTAYTVSFIVLGLGVAMNALTGSQLAILQGLSRLKPLSRAGIGGAVAGLAIVIPMYYFWRLDSILPSIIVYSAVGLIAAYIFRERFTGHQDKISRKETMQVGRKFLTLGLFITISDIFNQLAVYVFVSWLNQNAGEDIVGFYQAGNTLFNRYVGLVFTAIAMEYYPRLTASIESPRRVSTFVSHEIKLALWILAPIIALFIGFAPLIVQILYASEFEVIVPFVTIAIIGTTLRAISWCMAIVILARGDGRLFMLTEGLSAIVAIVLNILGYKMSGLVGLGASYVVWYLTYTLIVYIVYRRRYQLTISRGIGLLSLSIIATVTLTAAATLLTGNPAVAVIIAIMTAGAAFYILRRA
ncbi:MAG: oligosaccharide flippase family protein [Muribaculaceae bacterium]|nr:oligosaccharide flippase family protein [Muribaculaceae bacterium]